MKILTIAIGERYLNMACTLAASVYGKHEIMLVTDQGAQGRKADLFTDIIEPFYVGETDLETAMINKLHIDHYGGGEPVLFLDADTIITRPIDERNLKPFEAIVLHKSIKYPDWCNHDEAKKLYGFTDYIRHNTSWVYCDGSKQSVAIFEQARQIYIDAKVGKIEVNYFRNEIPDEVCIDIAVSILTTRKVGAYIPIYLPFINYEGFIHTHDNYYGISLAGTEIKSSAVVKYYNELTDYFCGKVGLSEKTYYSAKSQPLKRRSKGKHDTAVFYHIAMIGNWESVVKEQLAMMHMSGLYAAAKSITIGCVGGANEKKELNQIIKRYPKISIGVFEKNIEIFEFPTLELLENHCKHFRDDYVLYFHTKGVFLSGASHWRAYMNHFNITLWQQCVQFLNEGYDTCGVKYIDETSGFPRHYSGNFWWAYAGHINTLTPLKQLNQKDRYQAEMWLCRNVHSMKVMSNVFIDYLKTPNFV